MPHTATCSNTQSDSQARNCFESHRKVDITRPVTFRNLGTQAHGEQHQGFVAYHKSDVHCCFCFRIHFWNHGDNMAANKSVQ